MAQAVLAGSQLALELLEEGVARRQPKYARLLAECACGLFERPPADIHGRLAVLAEGASKKVLLHHLEQWLRREVPASLSAWTALFPLVGHELPEARDLTNCYWPAEPAKQLEPLQVPTAASAGGSWVGLLEEAVRGNHPRHLSGLRWLFELQIQPEDRDRARRPFSWFASMPRSYLPHPRELLFQVKDLDLDIGLLSVQAAKQVLADLKVGDVGDHKIQPGWMPLLEGRRFAMSPSAKSLAEALRRISESPASFPLRVPGGLLPWVLEACLSAAETPAESTALADRAAAGKLGDVEIWRAAEGRWRDHGATLHDLLYMTDRVWPFDRTIAERGVVFSSLTVTTIHESLLESYVKFVDCLSGARRLQEILGWAAQVQLAHYSGSQPPDWLSPEGSLRLFQRAGRRFDTRACATIALWVKDDSGWLDVLDAIGRSGELTHSPYELPELPALFGGLFRDYSNKAGLLPMLAAAVLRTPDSRALSLAPVQFEEFADLPVRRAALLLELARGGLTVARAAELAAVTVGMAQSDKELFGDATRILEGFERFDAASERYLLELRGCLQGHDWKDSRAVFSSLEDIFRHRSSGLADQDVWRSLALPEGLLLPLG